MTRTEFDKRLAFLEHIRDYVASSCNNRIRELVCEFRDGPEYTPPATAKVCDSSKGAAT